MLSFILRTLQRSPPRAWQVPALWLGALCMASCSSSSAPKFEGVPGDLPDVPLYGSAATPPHSMSRGEYPFDANGNYMTAWAAQGGSASTSYSSSHEEEMPPEPAPVLGKKGRKPLAYVTSAPPEAPPINSRRSLGKVENAPPELRSSYAASGTRETASEPASRRGGAAKTSATKNKEAEPSAKRQSTAGPEMPKSKKKSKTDSDGPKPKKKATKHVVKSTDTLAGIAKKYGTTEAKLKAANGLKSDVIKDGHALTIPK